MSKPQALRLVDPSEVKPMTPEASTLAAPPEAAAEPANDAGYKLVKPQPEDAVTPGAPKSAWMLKLETVAGAIWPTLLMVALLLGVWQIATSGPESQLPSPSKIWTEKQDLITKPFAGMEWKDGWFAAKEGESVGLGVHILTSLSRVAIGFSLAAVAGILLGMLIGQSRFAFRALDPLVQVLRTVPPLAWLPLSLAIFMAAQPAAIFLIFITAIWPILLNTAVGVQNIPVQYRNVAKVLQLNAWEFATRIMLPATVPYMFTGLRIGVGMSWLAIVAAEMVQGGTGVGFYIWDSYNASDLPSVIVALVYIGLVGFALDRLVGFIGKLVSRQA
jgi:nitrate/nitrite transport system permease protein